MDILIRHLKELSIAVPLRVNDDLSWFIADKVLLPSGYNWATTPILFFVPPDYPLTPPGLTSEYGIYLPNGLRYLGEEIPNYHENVKRSRNWCWYCYKEIRWEPTRDNLIVLLELVRTDLCNPYR